MPDFVEALLSCGMYHCNTIRLGYLILTNHIWSKKIPVNMHDIPVNIHDIPVNIHDIFSLTNKRTEYMPTYYSCEMSQYKSKLCILKVRMPAQSWTKMTTPLSIRLPIKRTHGLLDFLFSTKQMLMQSRPSSGEELKNFDSMFPGWNRLGGRRYMLLLRKRTKQWYRMKILIV